MHPTTEDHRATEAVPADRCATESAAVVSSLWRLPLLPAPPALIHGVSSLLDVPITIIFLLSSDPFDFSNNQHRKLEQPSEGCAE